MPFRYCVRLILHLFLITRKVIISFNRLERPARKSVFYAELAFVNFFANGKKEKSIHYYSLWVTVVNLFQFDYCKVVPRSKSSNCTTKVVYLVTLKMVPYRSFELLDYTSTGSNDDDKIFAGIRATVTLCSRQRRRRRAIASNTLCRRNAVKTMAWVAQSHWLTLSPSPITHRACTHVVAVRLLSIDKPARVERLSFRRFSYSFFFSNFKYHYYLFNDLCRALRFCNRFLDCHVSRSCCPFTFPLSNARLLSFHPATALSSV